MRGNGIYLFPDSGCQDELRRKIIHLITSFVHFYGPNREASLLRQNNNQIKVKKNGTIKNNKS